jgi:hypothetical protein
VVFSGTQVSSINKSDRHDINLCVKDLIIGMNSLATKSKWRV